MFDFGHDNYIIHAGSGIPCQKEEKLLLPPHGPISRSHTRVEAVDHLGEVGATLSDSDSGLSMARCWKRGMQAAACLLAVLQRREINYSPRSQLW